MMSNTPNEATVNRDKEVKTILISQPQPTKRNPYEDLADKYGVTIDFRKFIQVEPVNIKDFRRYRIDLTDFTAVIFMSKGAIEHFFALCKELRVTMPADTKYVCASEAVALYLQKFIEFRKRKVFFDKKDGRTDIYALFKKHKAEKFLYPCANNRKQDIPNYLKENDFDFFEAVIYNTVSSDLSDLENIFYDMIVFYTPLGVQSLYDNFPEFKQNNTRLAAYGNATIKAMEDRGLTVDVKAPTKEAPSVKSAIENYLKKVNQ